MSGTLNKVMLIGHLGDEVKLRYFDNGGCIGRFPLATNESYTNKQSGEQVTNTEWHNVLVRNKAAETCRKITLKREISSLLKDVSKHESGKGKMEIQGIARKSMSMSLPF